MEPVKTLKGLGLRLPTRVNRAIVRGRHRSAYWHSHGHINYNKIKHSDWDCSIGYVIELFKTGEIDKIYGIGPYYKGLLAKAIVEKCGCKDQEVLKYIPKEPDMEEVKSRLKETLSSIESTLNDDCGVADMFDRLFECRSTIEFVLEELK